MFIHAIAGCDIISFPYGIGKGSVLKKHQKAAVFREQADVFAKTPATSAEIISAGEKAIVSLYKDSNNIGLTKLRYMKFCDKVVTKKSHVTAQSLPDHMILWEP